MCGIGVVEPRREPGLAQKALHGDVAPAQPLVQDLDDRFSSKLWLLAAIDLAVSTFANRLAKNEPADGAPGQVDIMSSLVQPARILVPVQILVKEQPPGE
jgi:hypothetical protein